MKNTALFAMIGVLALALVGCNPIYTDHDWDPDADFARYATYSWMEIPAREAANVAEAQQQSQLVDKRVKNGVNRELVAKGFKEVSADGDLLVVYYMGAKQITEISQSTYSRGDMYASMFVGGGNVNVDNITEGSIIIDLVDGGTEGLVWRGSAETSVKEGTSTEKRSELLDSAIKKIFEKYPPKK